MAILRRPWTTVSLREVQLSHWASMKGLSKTICWSALICTLSGDEAATEITLGRLKLPFNFCSV